MLYIIDIGLGLLDFLFMTLLFAIIFRYFPSVKIKWKDTWFGALLTALLFYLGKSLIEVFIGSNEVANLRSSRKHISTYVVGVLYVCNIFIWRDHNLQ